MSGWNCIVEGLTILKTDYQGRYAPTTFLNKDRAVQLLIDEDILKSEDLGCHPCVCTSSLKIRTDDIIRVFLPATGHDHRVVHLVGED